jgi:kynurenine formamidase
MVIVDISQPLRPGEEIVCEIPEELPSYLGYPCEEYRFELRSHVGCYFETSAHLFRGATMTCDVPVERLLLPAVIARLDPDGEGAIGVAEIEQGLASEPIRPGDALIVDARGRDDRYFARGCAAWMAERQVSLLSATLPRFDTGFINPTGLFVELFRAEIPILAGIRNTGRISRQRVFLVVLPLLIERVCTVPCRAVVLDGPPEEIECLTRMLRPDLRGP